MTLLKECTALAKQNVCCCTPSNLTWQTARAFRISFNNVIKKRCLIFAMRSTCGETKGSNQSENLPGELWEIENNCLLRGQEKGGPNHTVFTGHAFKLCFPTASIPQHACANFKSGISHWHPLLFRLNVINSNFKLIESHYISKIPQFTHFVPFFFSASRDVRLINGSSD